MAVGNKLKCTNCGKTRATEKYFYMSHSHIYSNNDGRVPICKDCVISRYGVLVEKYEDEFKALYHLCMNLDIYYNSDLAMSIYSKIDTSGKDNLARVYFSKVNSLKQYAGLTSLDSDMVLLDDSLVKEEPVKEKISDNEEGFTVTPQMQKKWGKGMSSEDYFFLESTYEEFTLEYDDKTPAQKLIFRQISKALLEGEKAIKGNNPKIFGDMNNIVSKLMNDGNIKPSQKSLLAEDDKQGWGVWIDRIENERPIGEPCEQFKDADKISTYITRWFTNQMQRVFDLSDKSDGDIDVDQN